MGVNRRAKGCFEKCAVHCPPKPAPEKPGKRAGLNRGRGPLGVILFVAFMLIAISLSAYTPPNIHDLSKAFSISPNEKGGFEIRIAPESYYQAPTAAFRMEDGRTAMVGFHEVMIGRLKEGQAMKPGSIAFRTSPMIVFQYPIPVWHVKRPNFEAWVQTNGNNDYLILTVKYVGSRN